MVFSGELFDDIEQHLIQILLAGFAAEVPRPLGDVPGLRVCRLLASVSGIEELADEHDRPDRNDGYCHKCDEPHLPLLLSVFACECEHLSSDHHCGEYDHGDDDHGHGFDGQTRNPPPGGRFRIYRA